MTSPRSVPFPTIRLKEIDRHVTDAYGAVLPDDDAGRDDLMIMLNHIAYKKAADPQWLMHDLCDRRAPWLRGEERNTFIRKAFANPIRYTADMLAEKLGITYARRQRLGLTTIGATDVPKEKREELRKERDKARKRKKRRKAGRVPREEYEANSVRRQAEAEGINPSTWYRRQKSAKSHYAADTHVASPKNGQTQQVCLQHTAPIAADTPVACRKELAMGRVMVGWRPPSAIPDVTRETGLTMRSSV